MHELVPPIFNFVIVIGILVFVLRKPLRELVATRSTSMKTQVEEAAAQKLEAEKRYNEFSKKLDTFKAEAEGLLGRARSEGEALKAQIIKEAETTAARILREAEATAIANAAEYRDRLTHETIAQAIKLTEQLLRERVSAADQQRLVSEYVKGVQST